MKIKALSVAIGLLVSYQSLCVYLEKHQSLHPDQGQFSQNILNAQSFLYDYNETDFSCILGSSLSCKINKDSLPKNLYNLSLNGQSVLDGLHVLFLKSRLPKTLLIETNVLHRPANSSFTSQIGRNSFSATIKEHLICFREKYVPTALLSCYMDNKMSFLMYYASLAYPSPKTGPSHISDSTQSAKYVALQRKHYGHLSKEAVATIVEVSTKLKHLESKGVNILFYQMPVDCSLEQMPLQKDIDQVLTESFPLLDSSMMMKNQPCTTFHTTDGIHLESESAQRYTSLFLESFRSWQSKF